MLANLNFSASLLYSEESPSEGGCFGIACPFGRRVRGNVCFENGQRS